MWVKSHDRSRMINLDRVRTIEQRLNEPAAGQDRLIARWSDTETAVIFEGPHDQCSRIYGAISNMLARAKAVIDWHAELQM